MRRTYASRVRKDIDEWLDAIRYLANSDDESVAEAVDMVTAVLFDDTALAWLLYVIAERRW